MKTKEELDALKEEINKVNEKICELTPEELEQVNGGAREPKAIDIIGQAVAAEITAELAVRK